VRAGCGWAMTSFAWARGARVRATVRALEVACVGELVLNHRLARRHRLRRPEKCVVLHGSDETSRQLFDGSASGQNLPHRVDVFLRNRTEDGMARGNQKGAPGNRQQDGVAGKARLGRAHASSSTICAQPSQR